MNFTSYESGFGTHGNGPNGPGQPMLGKSSRAPNNNEFVQSGLISTSAASNANASRNQAGMMTNSTNAMIKSQQ